MAFFGITQLGPPNNFQAGLVSALGLTVFSDEEFEAAFQKMDKDGSGTIKVYEFLEAIAIKKDRDTIIKAFTNRSAIRKQFVKLDKDKKGYITRDQFKKSLETSSKTKLSKEQMDKIMKNADENGDGKIDYDEFLTAMTL